MDEICSAVERIDNPNELVLAAALVAQSGRAAAFLGKEAVVGIGRTNGFDDVLLDLGIDFRDEIVPVLGMNLQLMHAIDAADNDVAGTARRAHGYVEHWLHKVLEQDF